MTYPGKHGVTAFAWAWWRWIRLHWLCLQRQVRLHGLDVVFRWINFHFFRLAAAPLKLKLLCWRRVHRPSERWNGERELWSCIRGRLSGKRICTRRAVGMEQSCWSSVASGTVLSDVRSDFCLVLCENRNWTRWSLGVPFNSGYSVAKYSQPYSLLRPNFTSGRRMALIWRNLCVLDYLIKKNCNQVSRWPDFEEFLYLFWNTSWCDWNEVAV